MTGLTPAVTGQRFEVSASRAGRLSVYVDGHGPPLLLVHSVNAAASAAEVRPLFEHYRKSRTVYAPDLPGFGFSERSDREYTPRLMTDALLAITAEIARRHGAAPFDALAVSLACEFLARAALEQTTLFRSLALVSPTGFNGGSDLRGAAGSTRFMPLLLAALRGPGWGSKLFQGLTRPNVIRYFLRRTWGSREIDETLWAYDVVTTRQPGAEHAPLYFVSGAMFSTDIHRVYEQLTLPIWMSHGVRGDFTDYRAVSLVRGRSNWQIDELSTGALPYFEQFDAFRARYDTFLASVATATLHA